jgi:hypothetical protein
MLLSLILKWDFSNEISIKYHPILKHLIKTNSWRYLMGIDKFWNQMLKFILLNGNILSFLKLVPEKYWIDGDKAIKNQYYELILNKSNLSFSNKSFFEATKNGDLNMLHYLISYVNPITPPDIFDLAVKQKKYDIIIYLHSSNQKATSKCFEYACENGDLLLLDFLNKNRPERGKPECWNMAAKKGHIYILYYLYNHTKIWCNDTAFINACSNGHLLCVQFLNQIRDSNYLTKPVDLAIKNKHYETVIWLLNNRPEGASYLAFKYALDNRDIMALDILFNFGYHQYCDQCLEYCKNDISLYNFIYERKYLLHFTNSVI